jgi:hypothetical protein
MRKRMRIAAALLVVASAAAWYGWRELNQSHADFTALEPVATMTSAELVSSFRSGISPWLNQPIEVTGVLVSATEASAVMEGGVLVAWADSLTRKNSFQFINENVVIQGRLIGFDDLFGEARMDQCVLR